MPNKNKNRMGVVFSTDPNFKFEDTQGEEAETLHPSKQQLRMMLDRKQRNGKEVTLIEGFIGKTNDLDKLGKELKTKCGTGGSIKDGQILIQGDQRKKLSEYLSKLGYKLKMVGN